LLNLDSKPEQKAFKEAGSGDVPKLVPKWQTNVPADLVRPLPVQTVTTATTNAAATGRTTGSGSQAIRAEVAPELIGRGVIVAAALRKWLESNPRAFS